MAYVLGYITADGCISVSKDREKNRFTLNITSAEKRNLFRIKKALESQHKISKKSGGGKRKYLAYQLQIRHPVITKDLMDLGIFPRKTYNLNPIKVPDKYFPDFVRGFFDGDGTVYIYKVNGVWQIKAGFVSSSLLFLQDLNHRLCAHLGIPEKTIHKAKDKRGKIPLYSIIFYVEDCRKLAKFMYGNNPILYLPRKRKVFEKWETIKRHPYIKQHYPSKIGWRLKEGISN